MQVDIEKRFCQSCGMPLDLGKVEYLGTNDDQTHSHEFCYYCLKDGKYTVDYTMEQMVDVWVKYKDKYNGYASTSLRSDELRSLLQDRLPGLSRWKQRQETENIHFEIINRVLVYINQHLFEPLDAGELAQVAGLSFFYFRRIFRETTDENVGSYIKRLRLEYVAYRLITTDQPVNAILSSLPLYSKNSLCKAFHKHFNLSPSAYRKHFNLSEESNNPVADKTNLEVNIVKTQPLSIIYLPVKDAYMHTGKYQGIWKTLIDFSARNQLSSVANRYISLSLDEPVVTPQQKCRFYIGITVEEKTEATPLLGRMEIPGGLYGIFRLKGSHRQLPSAYRDIYQHWLPLNGYIQREPLTFEIYLNSPREVPVSELITDIYIPLEKKNKK